MPKSLLEILNQIKPLSKVAYSMTTGGADGKTFTTPATNKMPGGGGYSGDLAQMMHDSMKSESQIKTDTTQEIGDIKGAYRTGRGQVARSGAANIANEVLTGASAGGAVSMKDSGSAQAGLRRALSVGSVAQRMAQARGAKKNMMASTEQRGIKTLADRNQFADKLKPFMNKAADSNG